MFHTDRGVAGLVKYTYFECRGRAELCHTRVASVELHFDFYAEGVVLAHSCPSRRPRPGTGAPAGSLHGSTFPDGRTTRPRPRGQAAADSNLRCDPAQARAFLIAHPAKSCRAARVMWPLRSSSCPLRYNPGIGLAGRPPPMA